MTPVAILREAQKDGIRFSLTPNGLELSGSLEPIDRWMRQIFIHRTRLIDLLKERCR